MTTGGRGGNTASWAAFLAMAFAVVGLAGVFGTYATQIPWQRLALREAALDRFAADPASTPDDILLGDATPALLAARSTGAASLTAAIAAQRGADRRRFGDEAADIALRLRIIIAVMTGGGMLFGAIVLRSAGKTAG